MKGLTFKRQIILGIVLVVIGNVTAFSFRNGMFSNAAWILYGLIFLVNPVYPERNIDEKKGRTAARIAGLLCIAIGLLTRFYL